MSNELLSGRRVLVLEDEMLVLMNIENMLAEMGCESVTAAASVNEALDLLAEQQFDVALLDVNLNGCESYPVADALAVRGVPFAFSTGYSAAGIRNDHRDRPVLRKPYQHAELVRIVTGLLAECGLELVASP